MRQLLVFLAMASMIGCAQNPATYTNSNAVQASYFGMHIGRPQSTPWPASNPGTLRIWDECSTVNSCNGTGTGTTWEWVNSSLNTYDWTVLDAGVNLAMTNSAGIIYVLGTTPPWASSNPSGSCTLGPGTCYPPSDLSLSGSTWSSNIWSTWVTAVVQRYCGRITTYELWNEADQPFWGGTQAQLAGLAQIAYPIVHSLSNCNVSGRNPNILLTPSVATLDGVGTTFGMGWLKTYMQIGGAQYADGIAFHGYGWHANPTYYVGDYASLRSFSRGLTGGFLPLYSTEGTFDSNNLLPSYSDRMSWVARTYLTAWSVGIQQYDYYAYDDALFGTMYSPSGLLTAAINTPGTGWNTGDYGIVDCHFPSGIAGNIVITASSGGVPSAIAVSNLGIGCTAQTAEVVIPQAPATGTGLKINTTIGATTNPVATAYATVKTWMVGFSDSCTRYSDGTWNCQLTKTSPLTRNIAAWNDNGAGTFLVPAGFGHYKDLFGNTTVTSPGSRVALTTLPLLFTN